MLVDMATNGVTDFITKSEPSDVASCDIVCYSSRLRLSQYDVARSTTSTRNGMTA